MAENRHVDVDRNWAVLRAKLLDGAPGAGNYPTAVKGFVLHCNTSSADPWPNFYQPVIIVVAQGRKLVRIGGDEYHYGENVCFVAGVDMPVTSCVMEASEEKPYLSMSLNLDAARLAILAARVPPSSAGDAAPRGAAVQAVGPGLLDAFLRLLELTETPEHIPVMENLLLDEIHYRLLASPFGGILRSFNTLGSQGNQISRAISWLKENYKEPLRVEKLAGQTNMAPSTFHKYFKQITTLSPLQYQKRLRLSEAQRLMLSGGHDVTQAAFAVGYESPTQFIREYKRLFGNPPRRNVMRMKGALRA